MKSKKRYKKYVCPLTGERFEFAVDRDLWTELRSKELAFEKRNLKPLKDEKR